MCKNKDVLYVLGSTIFKLQFWIWWLDWLTGSIHPPNYLKLIRVNQAVKVIFLYLKSEDEHICRKTEKINVCACWAVRDGDNYRWCGKLMVPVVVFFFLNVGALYFGWWPEVLFKYLISVCLTSVSLWNVDKVVSIFYWSSKWRGRRPCSPLEATLLCLLNSVTYWAKQTANHLKNHLGFCGLALFQLLNNKMTTLWIAPVTFRQ